MRSLLCVEKAVLNSRCSVKRGWLIRYAHARSTLFFSSNSKWFQQHATVCTDTLYFASLLFKVDTKGCSKISQAYILINKVHVYSTLVPYSGTCTCKWPCARKIWLHVAGHVGQVVTHHRDFSVQNHPCIKFRAY